MVELMVFYHTVSRKNAALPAKYFGISRKTFHKWFKRFGYFKYSVRNLANRFKAPHLSKKYRQTAEVSLFVILKSYRQPRYSKIVLKRQNPYG
jgi:hypothetical protein